MTPKELKSLLSVNAIDHIKKITATNDKAKLIYRTASEFITADEILPLEEFLTHRGFQNFIKARLRSSSVRLEITLSSLIRRIALEINPSLVAEIAGAMSATGFRDVEKSFFRVPVDRKSYELFERGFILVGEQNTDLLEGYISFFMSDVFIYLKSEFREDLSLFTDIIIRIINLYLAKKSPEFIIYCAEKLVCSETARFIHISNNLKKSQHLLVIFFEIFNQYPNIDLFFEMIKIYSKHYAPFSETNEKYEKFLYGRLMSLWNIFIIIPPEQKNEFKEFLKLYGNRKDEFQEFIWNIVLEIEPEKSLKAISLFISTAFNSIKNFYSQDTKTIKFLIKNIIAALMEMDIKDIGGALYTIVLKLLIGLKIDKNFLQRRANFFSWLKKKSSSIRIEMEIIRFLFFEYIFIALHLTEESYNLKMTKFCDESHRFFCTLIDNLNEEKSRINIRNNEAPYNEILERLRKIIWQESYRKFVYSEIYINEIKSIAESTDNEDGTINSLEETDPYQLRFYYNSLIDVFRNDPERIDEAIIHDFWYRVPLNMILPYAQSVAIPLAGTIEIIPTEDGARTDGRVIYLPEYISYFKDLHDPLLLNRNLTVYIGLTLHEAGHIIGGSFKFNYYHYFNTLERPYLFKYIMNVFEDHRIESFLKKINAHHQVEDILNTLNEYYSIQYITIDKSMAVELLMYIFDEAGGYNGNLKSIDDYNNSLEKIFSRDINTGRFRSLKELTEYGISRLKSMDVANPLGAYPLAREFYEIMKHWSEIDLYGILDPDMILKGIHDYNSINPEENRPLTQEELNSLYKEYNENPRAFLERNELPVYENAITTEGKGEIKKGNYDEDSESRQNIENFTSNVIQKFVEIDYESEGTIDFSHRTKADNESAKIQKEKSKESKSKKKKSDKKIAKEKERPKKRVKTKSKKKYVYNIDPKTKSRTKISEIEEFLITEIDSSFFSSIKKWEYLSERVSRHLSLILPTIEDEHDTSQFEGELNIELLIDILSQKSSPQMPEIFDIFKESTRSLDVIIGLDASGSTDCLIDGAVEQNGVLIPAYAYELSPEQLEGQSTILDIEKTFACIFARALKYITNEVNIYAFNSITSTNVYKAESIDAVSSFTSGAANRDGDFIRYIKDILEKSSADVKYFFLLSDGQPSSDNYNGKEALDDTLIAMRETVNEGIKLIYFNFDFQRSEYFELFKKEATYAQYFTSPEQILPVIPELINTIVKSIR